MLWAVTVYLTNEGSFFTYPDMLFTEYYLLLSEYTQQIRLNTAWRGIRGGVSLAVMCMSNCGLETSVIAEGRFIVQFVMVLCFIVNTKLFHNTNKCYLINNWYCRRDSLYGPDRGVQFICKHKGLRTGSTTGVLHFNVTTSRCGINIVIIRTILKTGLSFCILFVYPTPTWWWLIWTAETRSSV